MPTRPCPVHLPFALPEPVSKTSRETASGAYRTTTSRAQVDSQRHRRAGRAHAVDQLLEVCEPSLWLQRGRVVIVAKHSEHRPHLVDGLPACSRDRIERVADIRLVAVEHAAASRQPRTVRPTAQAASSET